MRYLYHCLLALLITFSLFDSTFAQVTVAESLLDLTAARQLIAGANEWCDARKFDRAAADATRAYKFLQLTPDQNLPDQAAALRVIARTHFGKGSFAESVPLLEKAVIIYHDYYGEQHELLAKSLIQLAQAKLKTGRYQEAITMAEKALAMQQQILPWFNSDIANSCLMLGDFHKYIKKYDEALFYYNQALQISLQLYGTFHTDVAECYSNIGQVYLYKKQYAKALETMLQQDSIMIRTGENEKDIYLYTCSDLGKVYSALKNYPEAIRCQEKALAVAKRHYETDNTNIATLHLYLGRAQLANGNTREAIESFLTSRRMLQRLLGEETVQLYNSSTGLANAYTQWYRALGQDSLLDISRQYFQLAVRDIDKMIRAETMTAARQKILYEAVPLFEKAIGTELLVLQGQHLPSALENAWRLSESMHSYLLLSATQEAKARHFAGIPDELLAKDSLLQAETTQLEKSRQALLQQGRSLTDSLVLAIHAQVFAKKEAGMALRGYFEKEFPHYYQLKMDLQTISLEQAQQMLSPQQTMLEYFTGDSSIFVLILHRNDRRMIEIPRDFPLTEWVQALREGINGYYTAKSKTPVLYEKTVRQYAAYGQKLQEKLLAPLAGSLTQELIIIPSEELANLPFEALLTATPADISNFKTYPFVLRKHTIHYGYSATMLHQMTTRKHRNEASGDLLAFAPFFDADTASLAIRLALDEDLRWGLTPLPFSGEEVIRAKKRLGGRSTVLTGQAGTKQAFQGMAGKFRVIHLATHGKANQQAGDFCFLAFSADPEQPDAGLLSVGELYNCSLNADLVVLSACETGIGEAQRGEGVVSLARAFAFAGAKSIISSLWSVNDKSTMQLMDQFYVNLKSGSPKNVSLTEAKRFYLEQYPGETNHPFYWAGFVAVGDMGAIKK